MKEHTLESLVRRRNAGVGVLRRNGYAATAQVYTAFVLGGLGNLGALFIFGARKQMVEFSLSAVAMAVFAVACTMFARRWSARNRPLTEGGQIIQAPEPVRREVDELLEPVAVRMNFDLTKLDLYLGKRMFAAIPSIVEIYGRLHLVLPLGFLKVIRERPDIARAMLVHELGHADQKDTKLWALANAYWAVAMRTFMPFICAILLLHLIGTALSVTNAYKEEIEAGRKEKAALEENDRQFAKRMQEIQAQVYPEPGFYVGPPQSRDLDNSFAEFSHDMQELLITHEGEAGRAKVENTLIDRFIEAFPAAFQASVFMLMFFAIRKLRRLSEEMADLAVVIYDDGRALQRALELFGGVRGKRRPFAIHPSTQWRLRRVARYMSGADSRSKDSDCPA